MVGARQFDDAGTNSGAAYVFNLVIDTDGDGVEDDEDNCPGTANADQADLDGDGVGDVCDSELNIEGALATVTSMVNDLGLKSGFANALQTKLDNALKSFNEGNMNASVGQLAAFINQVNAKRGKDISGADADTPIDAAEAIVDAISGGSAGKRSDLADALGSELPETVILSQNYPNPFNPQTTIRFGLPETADVRLVVYDLLGRQVMVLVQGTLSAGMHDVTFDAGSLPSGAFIYRLDTPAGSLTKMLLLLK